MLPCVLGQDILYRKSTCKLNYSLLQSTDSRARGMMLYFQMRHYSYNAIKRDEGSLMVILLMLMVFNAEVLC